MPGYRHWVALSLARAALADISQGGGTEAIAARMASTLGAAPAWVAALASELGGLSAMAWQRLDTARLAQRIESTPAFGTAFADGQVPRIRRLILRPPRLLPRPLGLEACALPALATAGDLASWLGLPPDRLEWLGGAAQRFRMNDERRPVASVHYRSLLRPKPAGGLRLIEAPKAELKQLQRQLLAGLLQHVPVHEAAHGFVAGRSVATHAAVHVGQAVVLHFDLSDFFPSIRAARVHALWRTLGYPEGVARMLTTLCTARTPLAVIERMREGNRLDGLGAKRLASAHLPQGAPTSPALANLCAFRLDLRLDGLAWVFGARYTRYADDLVFSGPESLRRQHTALQAWVAGIVADEGFRLHPDKTRCMPRHHQQRVCGIVVNEQAHAPRLDFDRLKAVLHLCARDGPQAHNRDAVPDFPAHLLGRIAWISQSNLRRKEKLHRLFANIVWTA